MRWDGPQADGLRSGRVNVNWTTGEGGTASCEPSVASFENWSGAVPSEIYSCATLGNSRHYVGLEKRYSVPGQMRFTALTVEITAALPLPAVPKEFSTLISTSFPAIGAHGVPPTPGGPILELVDLATPAVRSSWGQLRARFR